MLKLVTGEELVVEITEESDASVTFKNPVVTVIQPSQSGNGTLATGFMPWMHAAEGPFTVNRTSVITVANVAEEVKNGYNRIFGAGIVVPPKGLITG